MRSQETRRKGQKRTNPGDLYYQQISNTRLLTLQEVIGEIEFVQVLKLP